MKRFSDIVFVASSGADDSAAFSQGAASYVVPALANDLGVELVVMGTVGRAGIPGLLIGNTAEDILGQIDCSDLTVKPAAFVSPVALEK